MPFTDTKSFYFLGSASQYIDAGNNLSFERTDRFSWCFWAKWSAASAMTMISKVGNSTAYAGYEIATDASKRLVVYLANDRGSGNAICVRTDAAFGDDTWHFIVVTYDGTSTAAGVLIYVDGQLASKTVITNGLTLSMVTANSLCFARQASGGGTNYFTGFLDEIAAYSDVVSASDVTKLYAAGYSRLVSAPCELTTYGPVTKLAGWWRADGDTLTTIKDRKVGYFPSMPDSSGYSNHGALSSGSYGSISTDATMGRVLGFSGSTFVIVGDVLDFDTTDKFSISVWFQTSTSGTMFLVGKQQAGGNYTGYSVQLDSGAILVELINAYPGSWLQLKTTQTNFNDNNWHHCIVTYGGAGSGSVHIYVDNAEKTFSILTNTLSGSISSTNKLQFGSRDGGTFPRIYTGNMCEVSIWAKDLSVSEVSSIWNSGIPNDLLSLSFVSSLRGWWHLGDNTYGTQYDGQAYNMNKTNLKDDWPVATMTANAQYLMRGISSATSLPVYWVSQTKDYSGAYAPEALVADSVVQIRKLA